MTLDDILVSPDLRSPVYLIEFQQGLNYWRYTTSNDEDKTLSGQLFVRAAISVAKLSRSLSESPVGTITLASDDPVVQIFDSFLPAEPVTCKVFFYEQNDPAQETRLVLSGEVSGPVDKDDGTTDLSVKQFYQVLNRSVPWQVQQVTCVLVHYGLQCAVQAESFKTTADGLTSLDNESVTASVFANSDPTWFKAGKIVCRRTREIRFITDQQANGKLIISYPFAQAKAADTFDAYAGCMRTGDICSGKFHNKINFMAFEKIPVKNMFRTGIK